MRSDGMPTTAPTRAAMRPPATRFTGHGESRRVARLAAVYAPTDMKAPWPMDTSPVYPTRMFRPLVSNEAYGPSSSLSDSVYDAFAEDAVGANHEREDHEDVRREVLGPTSDVRVDVAGRDVLHDPDDETADDRSGNGVEATENHDR